MNEAVLVGKWKQLRGKVKEFWGDLTDDDLDRIDGQQDQIVGLLQEKYGWARERAEREYEEFVASLDY